MNNHSRGFKSAQSGYSRRFSARLRCEPLAHGVIDPLAPVSSESRSNRATDQAVIELLEAKRAMFAPGSVQAGWIDQAITNLRSAS